MLENCSISVRELFHKCKRSVPQVESLLSWELEVGVEESGQLVEAGREEHRGMGRRSASGSNLLTEICFTHLIFSFNFKSKNPFFGFSNFWWGIWSNM